MVRNGFIVSPTYTPLAKRVPCQRHARMNLKQGSVDFMSCTATFGLNYRDENRVNFAW